MTQQLRFNSEAEFAAWRAHRPWTSEPSAARQAVSNSGKAGGNTQAINEQSKIVRQATKDKRNKLEKAYDAEVLYWQKLRGEIRSYRSQAVRLQLANGVTYLPDNYVVTSEGRIRFIEIKGEKRNGRVIARDDAAVKIKLAAKEYPEHEFVLAWKGEGGQWMHQVVREVE